MSGLYFPFPSLWDAAACGEADAVIKILDAGSVEVNAVSNEVGGLTALMEASYGGNTECVEALLQRGADANLKDGSGRTALMMASEQGQTECVKALLLGGADANIKDDFGSMTALMLATYEGNTACVKALLLGGADANIKDDMGNTALDRVKGSNHHKIIELLQSAQATTPPAGAGAKM